MMSLRTTGIEYLSLQVCRPLLLLLLHLPILLLLLRLLLLILSALAALK